MRYLVSLLLLTLAVPAQARLAPEERAVAASVTRETERHIALLERLVNQNSGTLNRAGVRANAELLRPEFEAIGMQVRWIDMAGTGRAGHLVATNRALRRRDGRDPPRHILLIGHLDTVFEPSSPFQRWRREGSRATGPGTSDMKGGNVIILAALRALHQARLLQGIDVTVVLTGDEERPGTPLALARRDLIAAGREADFALEFEALARQDGQDLGTVARRSSSTWTLTTRGRTGHSSGIFNQSLGYGAIYEMARILDAFRRELPEANLTYNVGMLAGGTPAAIDETGERLTATGKTNIVPDSAIARGDLRTLTPEQDARVRVAMQAIVAQHLPHTSAELAFAEGGYPPMAPSEGNRQMLARLNEVNRDLGLPEMGEQDPARRGAADSGFVAADVPTLGGLGIAGGGAHAEGEWADLDSFSRQTTRAALLINRLARQPR